MKQTRKTLISLRVKLAVFLLVALAAYAVVVRYCLQEVAIVPSFESLERENAAQDIRRCLGALKQEVRHLDIIADDWAAWDDTYIYMEDRNGTYIESNMTPDTFIDTRFNLIALFD
ncbi:MAG: histidine kinase, partial [bacterium]|nr:histidine kinase [bacterium]